MTNYHHGVRINESPTSLATPVVATSGIQVVFGVAPVNLLSDPSSVTNKLVLCNTFDEAKSRLGYSSDVEYTLCQSMDASFKLFGVAPVVFCNVLDPKVHKKVNAETTYTIQSGKCLMNIKGILLDSIVVKSGDETLVVNTDYVTSFDNEGNVIVVFVSLQTGEVLISSESIDPTLVQAADIIGGIDESTHKEKGLELIRQVYPLFDVVPGTIIAPGYSANANVSAALANKCVEINGVFTAECAVDLDTSNATYYTECEAVKNSSFMTNMHMTVLWPKIKIDERIFDFSVIYAALLAYTDYENGNIPSLSPSNKLVNISGAVLQDGTEVVLDEPQANELNAVGIVTAINQNGWRIWGNNTAAYPENTDPKDRWICCRRFFSWWGNSFILEYRKRVDDPANFRLIESIVDSENIRGNSYVAQGKCAGCKIVYRKEDNPIQDVLNGKIEFKQYLAPYTPAEDICNTLEFDPNMLESALGGE